MIPLMKTLVLVFALAALPVQLLSAIYNKHPAGAIKGARMEWVSDTSIRLSVGYGDNGGAYWEIGPNDPLLDVGYTLSGLPTSSNGLFAYIYIDSENSLFPNIVLRHATSSPTWSDTYFGWYSGNDRCIGAVWVGSDGKIASFLCSDDETYYYVGPTFMPSGQVATTYPVWTNLDCSNYAPVNASELKLEMALAWNGSGTRWAYCRSAISAGSGTILWEDGVYRAVNAGWLPFARNSSKTVSWLAYAQSSSGTVDVKIRGYRLER